MTQNLSISTSPAVRRLRFRNAEHEVGDTWSFHFDAPQPVQFRAGQHALFLLPALVRPHPFSISSSPQESTVSFTTRVRAGSSYKSRLVNMRVGDRVAMLGPVGGFVLDESSQPCVLLAQGIGVTPFRSMLLDARSRGGSRQISLIHVDREHAFASLTRELADPAMYPKTADELHRLLSEQRTDGTHYVSGSSAFVKSTVAVLRDKGITNQAIRTDSFLGYAAA